MAKQLKPMAVRNNKNERDPRIVALDEADAKLAKIKTASIEREKRLGLNQKSHVYMKTPSNFRISVGVCLGCAWVVLMFCIAVGIISRGA